MTVEDVKKRLAEIRASVNDDERAHGLEDKLREDVLRAISGRAGGMTIARAQAIASLALSSNAIEFSRWSA